jgi:hypothetical protein
MYPDAILVTCDDLFYMDGKNQEDAVDVKMTEEDLQFIINEAYKNGSLLWDSICDRHRELRDERRTEVAA